MSNICLNNSNNVGCKNGQLYCNDPRCYPNCQGCNTNTSSGNWIIITIILVLLGVLLVMSFIIGYDWYNKTNLAAEPKNLTVNKHIHNIQQPPIVVNPSVIERNIATSLVTDSLSSLDNNNVSLNDKISYNGVSLNFDDCE